MSPISRGGLQLVAGADGVVPPMSIMLGAYDSLDQPDGGASGGAILLALRTWPGTPSPDGPLDMRLIDDNGDDCLYGLGLRRSHEREQRTILRAGKNLHAIIYDGEIVTLHISGNRRPGAVVHVELTYADHREEGYGWQRH